MTTKREQVLTAIHTALTGTTGVGTRIYRSRVEPLSRQESPAIVIEPISDQAQQNTSLPTLDWSLTVRVAIIVRGNGTIFLGGPPLVKAATGEVVSADSRQVYRGMDLASGKDLHEYTTPRGAVPCHLIDVADPGGAGAGDREHLAAIGAVRHQADRPLSDRAAEHGLHESHSGQTGEPVGCADWAPTAAVVLDLLKTPYYYDRW